MSAKMSNAMVDFITQLQLAQPSDFRVAINSVGGNATIAVLVPKAMS